MLINVHAFAVFLNRYIGNRHCQCNAAHGSSSLTGDGWKSSIGQATPAPGRPGQNPGGHQKGGGSREG